MTSTESKSLTSAAPGPVSLQGGRYLFSCVATFGGGSVALQGLLPDGTTYATVPDVAGNAVSVTVAGWKTVDLAPGQYKITIVTATSVLATVASLPG